MSNGLTLEYITDYYCIKNGNDSAILVFSKLLSKPILKLKKKKTCIQSICRGIITTRGKENNFSKWHQYKLSKFKEVFQTNFHRNEEERSERRE